MMRVGLLVDNRLSKEAKFLLDNIEIQGIYVQRFGKSPRGKRLTHLIRKVFFRALTLFEDIFIKDRTCGINNYGVVRQDIFLEPKGSLGRYFVTKNSLELIARDNLDVLVRCGSGILTGDILGLAKYGVISLHHADPSFMRGRPAGFYENIFSSPETGFIIQRLTNSLDGGQILYKGCITTSLPWRLNYVNVYERSLHYLKLILSSEKHMLRRVNTLPYSGPIFTTPSLVQQLKYLRIISASFFRFLRNRLTNQRYLWSVFILLSDDFNGVRLSKGKQLIPREGSWLADPFVIVYEGVTFIFVEDFKVIDGKAVISVYKLQDSSPIFLGEAIKEAFHLSFPRVFVHRNKYYLTLESADEKGIRIYCCDEFPLKWSYSHSILTEYRCADPIFYLENDKIVLLVSLAFNGVKDFNTDLFRVEISQDLTVKDPKLTFPIISSVQGGRNAGLAMINGQMKRIGQNQGYLVYGKNLTVHDLKDLSLECEIKLHEDSPYFGIHTLNSDRGVYVYDMARYRSLNNH